jgi:hypothetical protein
VFYNEKDEGWAAPDPLNPYTSWVNRTGRDLDRGVISQVAGGAFCPGCELPWVMRNPSIYHNVHRVKADPAFAAFQETAAQANQTGAGGTTEREFSSYIQKTLSLDNDFDKGLQPGDLTKYMALPWQADFNECSTQTIDVTYEGWNVLYPKSAHDQRLEDAERKWQTLWWPAHRPMQVNVHIPGAKGQKPSSSWQVWALGVPQTREGDFKMVTEWSRLGFVIRNPLADPNPNDGDTVQYISVEGNPSHFRDET